MSNSMRSTSWFTPALLLAGFILVFGILIGLIQFRIESFSQKEMASDIDAVAESIRLRLKGNEDYLVMLAKDRAENALNQNQFQIRASHYVKDHPEMINITWVDSIFNIQDVAPREGNEQIIGLHLDLAEPQKASRKAKELRLPQYTKAFEAIQGNPSFEIWIPVFRGNTFLGLLAGVYSCEKVVNFLVPEQMKIRYKARIEDENSLIVWQQNLSKSTISDIESKVLIATAESGLMLCFTRIGWGLIDWTLVFLIILSLGLVGGMAFSMWKVSVEMDRRRMTENILKKQNDEFAQLNEEYKFINTELQLAKEKAESADRLKSAFLANVSHEIRTPLNSIVGFSSLLIEPDLKDEDKHAYVNMIESNTESLLVLIDEIIDLSKIEAQQLTLKKEEFNVDKLILELFQIFKHENSNCDVVFLIEKISDNMDLFANSDRVRVRQILINLLTNAFKFTESGSVKMGYLKIDGNVVLFVKDTGIGISEEHHQVIFQRFRKLNEIQDKRIYRGTGLGLAITEKLVELLGGQIWVESDLGKGSCFYFTLPDLELRDVKT